MLRSLSKSIYDFEVSSKIKRAAGVGFGPFFCPLWQFTSGEVTKRVMLLHICEVCQESSNDTCAKFGQDSDIPQEGSPSESSLI